jgi:hypothetical protein
MGLSHHIKVSVSASGFNQKIRPAVNLLATLLSHICAKGFERSFDMDAFHNNDHSDETRSNGDVESESARRPPRNSLFMLSKITFHNTGKLIEARVRNISSGGMLVESSVFCEPGDQIEAELRNIDTVKGRVSWREGNHFGIAFDHAIDPDQVRFTKPASQNANSPTYIRTFEEQYNKKDTSKIRRI